MKSFLYLFVLIPQLALATSAYRDPEKDYTYYESKIAPHVQGDFKSLMMSPLRSASLFDEANLGKATGWKSLQVMQERFEKIRDHRFLESSGDTNFPRRISWLYPKDGCWIRAALFNRNAFQLFIPVPSKIFAFGNLKVETPNSSRGKVTWWYHVAPIVQVGGEKYVLDPAIEPTRPLELKEWLDRMGRPEKIKIAICNSGAYSPGSDCSKKTDGLELRAERVQKHYLRLEKKELLRLGEIRKWSVEKILPGDFDEWRHE